MSSSKLLLPVALALLACTASAHDARPLSVVIAEEARHLYRVELLVPPSVDSINQPVIQWPAGCEVRSQTIPTGTEARRSSSLVGCADTLENKLISVHYALFNPSLATFIRLTPIDGPPLTAVLPPETPAWRVPVTPSRLEVAREYLVLGVKHIWTGVDHLLFVAGLLILARTGRRIVLAITGFSVAHSITLSLSALGFVHIPVPPTEAAIALSIIFLATEIARGKANSLATRYPLLVSTSFGLLHGLGFAAALGEIGLPPTEIPTSLLLFNVGVECGQLAFILPIIGLMHLRKTVPLQLHFPRLDSGLAMARSIAPYGIGILSSFWFFERLGTFRQ